MKAILVIDMPNNCFECLYCGWANENPDLRACMLMEGTFFNDEQEELDTRRSMICPLKPMPEKRSEREYPQYSDVYGAYCKGEDRGWNDCLKELEK